MNATVQAPAEIDPKQSKADPPFQPNGGSQEKAATPSGDAPSSPADIYVCDRKFIREIRKLQLMRSIQLDEGVQQPPEIPELWHLLELRHGGERRWPFGRNGRWPKAEERANLDRVSAALSSKMTKEIKKKLASAQVPIRIAYLPMAMLIVAALALCSGIYAGASTSSVTLDFLAGVSHEIVHAVLRLLLDFHLPHPLGGNDFDQFVVCYLFWSISMGVIGAAASVGMNAIFVSKDATFDISNRHQLTLRLVLGGVFALVLVLPFGLASFASFCYYAGHLFPDGAWITAPVATAASKDTLVAYTASSTSSLTYAFALLAPFLLGYSTFLLTSVLSQLINFVQKSLDPNGQSEDAAKDQAKESSQSVQSGTALTRGA